MARAATDQPSPLAASSPGLVGRRALLMDYSFTSPLAAPVERRPPAFCRASSSALRRRVMPTRPASSAAKHRRSVDVIGLHSRVGAITAARVKENTSPAGRCRLFLDAARTESESRPSAIRPLLKRLLSIFMQRRRPSSSASLAILIMATRRSPEVEAKISASLGGGRLALAVSGPLLFHRLVGASSS